VVELHEECAAPVPNGVHVDLHVVRLAADSGDAFEDHSEFLDAVTHFFVQFCFLSQAEGFEVFELHFGFLQQLSALVLQVFLGFLHDLVVEVAEVYYIEFFADL
jgi:hypothetical protein